jgi:hypothetical protein
MCPGGASVYPGAQEADIRAHIHIYLVRGTRHASAYKKHTSAYVGVQEAYVSIRRRTRSRYTSTYISSTRNADT